MAPTACYRSLTALLILQAFDVVIAMRDRGVQADADLHPDDNVEYYCVVKGNVWEKSYWKAQPCKASDPIRHSLLLSAIDHDGFDSDCNKQHAKMSEEAVMCIAKEMCAQLGEMQKPTRQCTAKNFHFHKHVIHGAQNAVQDNETALP
mmetsp:Transcript_52052/g.111419  ORF Transcript_52052/g.111419 Transcript_52052/m.111419 type:complete len:148 (+) Transcript_52052:86-529(+)